MKCFFCGLNSIVRGVCESCGAVVMDGPYGCADFIAALKDVYPLVWQINMARHRAIDAIVKWT